MADSLKHFTPFARAALELADAFAQEMNHRLIDPAHLWIGLWVVEGSASSVLRKLDGMTYPDLQQLAIVETLVVVYQASGIILPRELTDASKAALEYAVDHARRLHHTQISTGHLLLGLLDLRDPLTGKILDHLIISPHELVRRIETSIDTCLPPDDRVEASVDEPAPASFVATLKQWFGSKPPSKPKPPKQTPAAVPKALRPQPITTAFLRDNVRDTNQVWLLNYAARMFEDVYDEKSMLDCYSMILKVCPPDSQRLGIVLNRGSAHFHHKDWDSALIDFERAIQLAPDNLWGYVNRGAVWVNKEQYAKAIEDLTHAIQLDPKHTLSLYNRGCAYRDNEQLDLALVDFNAVLKLQDNDVKTLIARGYLHRRRGNRDAALADAATAQRLDGDNYRGYHLQGYIFRDAYEFDKAREAFAEALRVKPDQPAVLRSIAWMHKMQKDFTKAISEYTRLIELDPEKEDYYMDRALTYIDMDEHYLAAVDLRNARQIKPDVGIQTEAWLHYKRSDYLAALQAATTAIEKEPKCADGYFTMACIMEVQGNQLEALRYFKLALDHWSPPRKTPLDPDYRQATEYVAKHDSNTPDANAAPA